ncbi:MAG TPA: P-type conjugative transfer protein TrbJ [Allosphingosinicella sp.]
MSRPSRPFPAASVWAFLGGALILTVAPALPARAVPVFDATNYAQNLLIASRSLDQISNQIRSLQNETAMLSHMATNLERIDFPQFEGLQQRLREIDRLMDKAKGIAFRVDGLDARFDALFPDVAGPARGSDEQLGEARARVEESLGAFRHTMDVQSQIVETIRKDAEALSAIVARSQGAAGALQAAQATNQLLALAAKQQFQLQQLMAAQFRSEAIEQTRRLQQSREARAAARRFLGQGRAYTPR